MTTENTATNHTHKFNECFRIICGITLYGGPNHQHCDVCGIAQTNTSKPADNWFERNVEGVQY